MFPSKQQVESLLNKLPFGFAQGMLCLHKRRGDKDGAADQFSRQQIP